MSWTPLWATHIGARRGLLMHVRTISKIYEIGLDSVRLSCFTIPEKPHL